ncbi:hypothetical protein WN943_015117 [Citrus x changshan-huyou]
MASSSRSHSAQSKYDVFLSFRGEDTRDNFTSHLHAAFCRKNIKTFIDEELSRGDEISQAVLNAMKGSKISVIIFSKRYASSKWCLDELVEILECKNMNGQTVVPVFYQVDPSDVRNQTGCFADAFVEHEEQFKNMPQKVQIWRAVLTEASNLSGWYSMNTRPEAKLVEEIVKDILKKLENITVSTNLEGLVGLNSRIEQIKSLLSAGSPDFRIVGLWGMGGIGKTTIAGALFNQISREFEGKCFMASVREESEKGGGLTNLRERVVSEVLGEDLKIRTPIIPEIIKKRLQQMTVFIVLDDVNKCGQLSYLTGGLDRFGPGSRIIVTTRDKQVLYNFGVSDVYEVKGLEYPEALELFCNHAFKGNHCPEDLLVLSKRVLDYANGNPLALRVLGSFLHRKSKVDWKIALENLIRISDPDIYDVLKVTYNELKAEEKSVPIMSSKVHLDQGLRYLPEELRYLHWHQYSLKTLPLNFDPENLIELNLPYNCVNLTEFPLVSGNIIELRLWNTRIEEVPSSIECLTNLETLDLSFCKRLKRVSTSICKLKSLCWLELGGCSNLETFPEILEKMEHLLEIDLRETAIRNLPSSIEYLEGLRKLDLGDCSELASLPEKLENLKSLKYLNAEFSAIGDSAMNKNHPYHLRMSLRLSKALF